MKSRIIKICLKLGKNGKKNAFGKKHIFWCMKMQQICIHLIRGFKRHNLSTHWRSQSWDNSKKNFASSNFRGSVGKDLKKILPIKKSTFLWSLVVVATLWTGVQLIFEYFHFNIPLTNIVSVWFSIYIIKGFWVAQKDLKERKK